jgi:ABC-2 type transport system ATP-binding protein
VGLFGDRVHVVVDEPETAAAAVRELLRQNAVDLTGVRPVQPSLEDVFVSVLSGENETAGVAA